MHFKIQAHTINAISSSFCCAWQTPVLPQPRRHHGPLLPHPWHQQIAHQPNTTHAVCHLLCTGKTRVSHFFKVQDVIEYECLATQVGQWTAVRSPPWHGGACRGASLKWFPIVAAAVRVAGFRPSWRWTCWNMRGHVWSAVLRTNSLLKMGYGGENQRLIQQLWWSFLQSTYLHTLWSTKKMLANSKMLCLYFV